MRTYRTPGAYIEWLDSQPPVAARRTDVAGFVGICERGPLHQPVRIQSWTQFVSVFGGYVPQGYLAYAVHGFFLNGGVTCWVVRAADPAAAGRRQFELAGPNGGLILLEASSPGVWANELRVKVTPSGGDRFMLSVTPPDGRGEVWQNLSTGPGDPRFIDAVLGHPSLGSRLVRPRSDPRRPSEERAFASDGLTSLSSAHLTGIGAPEGRVWGLAALDEIDEVAVIAVPDIMSVAQPVTRTRHIPRRCDVLDPPAERAPLPSAAVEFAPRFEPAEIAWMQRAVLANCESRKDRFAILDFMRETTHLPHLQDWRRQFISSYGALYFPWIRVSDPLGVSGLLREVPPCGHLAGIYARNDRGIGVHKAPANELVEDASDSSTQIDDNAHAVLNESSVNAIRSYPGRGLRVMGARTLAARDDTQWRYVNVRRLMMMITEAIAEAAHWTVFEPNDRQLWREVDRMVRNFLDGLWERGMLDGASRDEAFSVRCDSETNPPSETGQGRVICEVGVQPPWPAEFVVVRIGVTAGGVEIVNAMEANNA